ncbi:glycoside hydrolase family 38 C-terminal domain-containing protein [Luteolibacter marinus]|uniref:glycoside hydrolase family 38 C-terminal domain-containing protein n=1 Tax=Luteolibacter marinus TaxID=2776705 RepID=UPI001867420D|nr:glycoside hydrolase family 38 C-terminal domain-containing protein [Luteolibacter marinus]
MTRPLLLALACLGPLHAEEARKAWFIDGYHGGVYGHYPPGYTSFLVEQLGKHPEWKINLEIEPETWDVARDLEPAAYAAFKKLIEAGERIEVVNPSYAQSYFFQSSGESVIRQFDHGIRAMRGHFPSLKYTTYSSEEPCFTSCLPGVLKSFGFEFASLKNPNTCWGGYTTARGGELVNWIGPDGTSILTVPRYESESLHPENPWSTNASGNSPEYIQAAFAQGIGHPVGMCLQDAGWGGGPWLKWSAKDHYRPTETILWSDYFRNVTAGETTDDWKFSQEDVKPGLMWGAQVLQRMAQQSREAEHRLLVAEKLAAMARVDAGRPARIAGFDEAWHNVLLSQHHDCWIVPYNGRTGNTWAEQLRRWTRVANAVSDLATETAIEALLHGEGRPRGRSVRLFNPTATSRDTVVGVPIPKTDGPSRWVSRDAHGGNFPTQVVASDTPGQSTLLVRATLPPMGYATVSLSEDKDSPQATVTTTSTADAVVLESDLYRIELDPAKGGTIRSLVSKRENHREVVDQASERRFNELRGHFYEQGGFHSSADHPATVTIIENGPLRATVEIAGEIAGSPFTQRLSLTQGSPVIDCNVRIDWQGNPRIGESEEKDGWKNFRRPAYQDRFKLLALFPTALDEPKLTKNAPFDVCESQLVDSFYESWDAIKHNLILDWVDVAGAKSGLALFSDHTTSYTHGPDHPLGLTLQYAGKGLWARDYRIEGPTEVRYALVPHAGKWDAADLPGLSAAWQEPATGAFSRGGETSDRSLVDPGPGWQVPAMFERDGAIFIRLFNSHGDDSPRQVKLGIDAGTVELVELDGRVIETLKPSAEGTVELQIPRLGFRTLRVSDLQPARRH